MAKLWRFASGNARRRLRGVRSVGGLAGLLVYSGRGSISSALSQSLYLDDVVVITSNGTANATISLTSDATAAVSLAAAATGLISLTSDSTATVASVGSVTGNASGTISLASSSIATLVNGANATGVISLTSTSTASIIALASSTSLIFLIGDSTATVEGGIPANTGDGGSSSSGKRVRYATDEEWEKHAPAFLRRKYEAETPQAQIAKRIARAVKAVPVSAAADEVQERGLEALRDSHSLYLSYIAHLLNSWNVPDLSRVNEALLQQVADASNRAQMIAAAQALQHELDNDEDEELLLLTTI